MKLIFLQYTAKEEDVKRVDNNRNTVVRQAISKSRNEKACRPNILPEVLMTLVKTYHNLIDKQNLFDRYFS